MDSSNSEVYFRRRVNSRRLLCDEPRNLQNSRPGPSTIHHVPSHYDELRQLEPEEDLMDFPSRPATPHTQPNSVNILVDDPSNQQDPIPTVGAPPSTLMISTTH